MPILTKSTTTTKTTENRPQNFSEKKETVKSNRPTTYLYVCITVLPFFSSLPWTRCARACFCFVYRLGKIHLYYICGREQKKKSHTDRDMKIDRATIACVTDYMITAAFSLSFKNNFRYKLLAHTYKQTHTNTH